MRPMRMLLPSLMGLILLWGCGYKVGYRHFAGPILPAPDQTQNLEVGDDHSITFKLDRLEISLRPMTDEILNRQFAGHSTARPGFYQNPSVSLSNPYTYGSWKPLGKERAPNRFTVFQLKVKNYAFPKVRVDPSKIYIDAPNKRHYPVLSLAALIEYYWPYAVGYSGVTYKYFQEREDLLRKTLYRDKMIFSGQENEGYIVFPTLDYDVEEFTIWIENIALRFDYRDEPVEAVKVPYLFRREIYLAARSPRPE